MTKVYYYDKRGCEMGNSVIHFVRAQSQQWFNTPPFEAAKSELGKLRPIPLGLPCGTFIAEMRTGGHL
ncbi:MAG: hypothetical protein COU10_01655 [Candidatus Harrisonbacteria bacterium CG10_big_fil_rev_8_21_14_0_10_45_28]|uniref:Uncharacterized protein n=1 Tax=Candidatus Harrisonbacteria bacterium CG10_big_fil_rev_8_21_14_0_10_45_28 TaxID=1974586 RepID=A0A2H0UNJ2_9BACT|nr:MAG: hypothetical protein COU10_01655 [Candidatus Harrisonbacteria bacterium CG10_big_fil_rev_8_21_14_0_10_45_28]